MNKLHFSTHAVSRFRERFPTYIDEVGDGNVGKAMSVLLYNESKPDKRIFNNTGFMVRIMEDHNLLNPSFNKARDIIFVIDNDTDTLITCYEATGRFGDGKKGFKQKAQKGGYDWHKEKSKRPVFV